MTHHKTNGLESAPTDQALANSESNQKQASMIMPNFIAPVPNSGWQVRLAAGNASYRKHGAYDAPASARKIRRMIKKQGAK
jgi:hypothetical protein